MILISPIGRTSPCPLTVTGRGVKVQIATAMTTVLAKKLPAKIIQGLIRGKNSSWWRGEIKVGIELLVMVKCMPMSLFLGKIRR
jgi:hypothetical protein